MSRMILGFPTAGSVAALVSGFGGHRIRLAPDDGSGGGGGGSAPPAADSLLSSPPPAGDAAPAPQDGNTPPTPPADGKPAADKPAEGEKPPGAPEAYEPFKMPEGVQIGDEKLTEFGQLAKELNLPQEAAQKLIDRFAPAFAEPHKQWQALQEQWVGEAKADPEIGGAKLDASLSLAAKALDRFGGDALREALNLTGAGNHPAVIKAFVQIGKAISEDSFHPGGGGARDVSTARLLYPTMFKE